MFFFRPLVKNTTHFQRRYMWNWINKMFNRVDEDRRKLVGPDRCCAEWVLRNGGAIKWAKDKEFLKDYNQLPAEEVKLKICEIDASQSSINHYGFSHLDGCDALKKMTLHSCVYLDDNALKELSRVKCCLKHLQISSCPNITDKGLLHLRNMDRLETLLLFDLPGVKDRQNVLKELSKAIPTCNLEFR